MVGPARCRTHGRSRPALRAEGRFYRLFLEPAPSAGAPGDALRAQKKGREITYTIKADGFLRYMVRTIVGTLIEVDAAGSSPGDRGLFYREEENPGQPDRPGQGLCLIKVVY